MPSVRLTVDVSDQEIAEAMEHCEGKTAQEVVIVALGEFNRRFRLKRLAARFGRSSDFVTYDELSELREPPGRE